jgi:type 1 glutamine amidotransferase
MFFDTPAYRKAVFDFAARGKGLVMLHPGTWYAFPYWPELNAKIVGGGSRGHDKLGAYKVNAVKPGHPIMKGVPASFDVIDELYYMNAEPDKIPPGTAPIEVLAESSPSQRFGKPHPVVWTTKHERARIVGFTLGHDERVHDHPAYRTLLTNAVKWASGKN